MKKKGFTLVELLAVIVVLAIILAIAVPKILDVIKSTRENSLISSVKLIARNAESKKLTNKVLGITSTITCRDVVDLSESDYGDCEIDFTGEEITVTLEGKGKFSGYTCSGTKNNVTCTGGSANNDWDTNALTVEEAINMGLVWYDIDDDSVGIGLGDSYEGTPESHLNFSTLDIPTSIGGKKVTKIGSGAFRGCTNLTSVTIPNSVTSIGVEAFDTTPWLDNQYNEDGLAIINNILYDVDNNISGSVTIPNSVTSIGEGAFYGCTNLTSVTIPNSVTSIGYEAFEGCENLASVTIPNSVTSIGEGAFYGTPWLDNLEYDENGLLIIGNMLYYVDNNISGSVTIPNSVTSIGDYAFYCCESLESVTIPNSVRSIGDYAFEGCENLTSVTIPNSVTSIGDFAFGDCTSLESVTIPNSVTSIDRSAFYGCENIESVNFVGNKVKIYNNLFIDTLWFSNNQTDGYILGENYLVRFVETFSLER